MSLRLQGLILLVTVSLAAPARAGEIATMLDSLIETENQRFQGSHEWVTAQVVRRTAALNRLARPLRVEFANLGFIDRETGRSSDAPPADYEWLDEFGNPKRPGSSALWRARLTAAPPAERCRLTQLAYAFAIIQLSTLVPSRVIASALDNNVSEARLSSDARFRELYQKDQRRANWAMRFLAMAYLGKTSSGQPLIPPSCEPCYARKQGKRDFCMSDVVKARLSVINYPAGSPGYGYWNRILGKWPLGWAIDHCSRPNSAHWHDLLSNPELEKQSLLEPIDFAFDQEPGGTTTAPPAKSDPPAHKGH